MRVPAAGTLPETPPSALPETIEDSILEQRFRALNCYVSAWANTEEREVHQLLGDCLTSVGSYVNPFVDPVFGVEGLTRLMLDYQVLFPHARVTFIGRPAMRHRYACWHWSLSSSAQIRLLGSDFGCRLTGRDIIQFSDEHRIASVVAFFDGPASARRHRASAATSPRREAPGHGSTRGNLLLP